VVRVANEDNHRVGLLHPSFRDFLQDKGRCTDGRFFADVHMHEHFMALRCMNGTRNRRTLNHETRKYASLYWPSHLRSGSCHGLSDELVQELIWLIGDEGTLVDLYSYFCKEDIIPFVRSLVEEHRPKESEILLALLRDAEANERIASARKEFVERRRRAREL